MSENSEQALAVTRARWERLRRETAPADRQAAEAGIEASYRAARLAPPDEIVWCRGPHELSEVMSERAFARAGANVKQDIAIQPVLAVNRQLRATRSFGFGLWSTGVPYALDPLSLAVVTLVRAAVDVEDDRTPVLRRLVNALLGRDGPAERTSITEAGVSQHDAPSLYLYDHMRAVDEWSAAVAPLEGLLAVAREVGWFIPHRNLAVACERHDLLEVDPEGRLHAANGPALRYPDGWHRHAWKGVAIPGWLFERSCDIQINRIERELDARVRHCMVDIMTPERFVREGHARCVARDECGVLWQRHWMLGGAWTAVEVVNGTPEPDGCYRHYFLTVPGEICRTPRQAVAWTYGLSPQQCTELRRRT